MSEPKNLVIKVKRTTPNLQEDVAPEMITEWNYKRIAGALLLLAIIAGICVAWLQGPEKINGWLRGFVSAPQSTSDSSRMNTPQPAPTAPESTPEPAIEQPLPVTENLAPAPASAAPAIDTPPAAAVAALPEQSTAAPAESNAPNSSPNNPQ